jgi:hypothetical protein
MLKILIDTCVWLDLAKDPKQVPVLSVIEELLGRKMIDLIVPRVVLDEFLRNRDRVSKENLRSLSTHFRVVKDAISRVSGDKKKEQLILSYLNDVDHKIPIVGAKAIGTLDRIEKLLTTSSIIETSELVRLRAAQRALEKKAPFHHGRNAMADAIIIETYTDCIRDKTESGIRFAFITHNKNDFSMEHGNSKLPHSDFSNLFSRIKSQYFINLPEVLRRIEPSLVTAAMFEDSLIPEPRGLTEILDSEGLLFNQVWYNRHWNMLVGIEEGRIKVVDRDTLPRSLDKQETIQQDVLNAARNAARGVERRFGKKNLGPWDDFEWGMINGKLSALRWVLGDEWDMLDT